jgi:hypothetical protein
VSRYVGANVEMQGVRAQLLEQIQADAAGRAGDMLDKTHPGTAVALAFG